MWLARKQRIHPSFDSDTGTRISHAGLFFFLGFPRFSSSCFSYQNENPSCFLWLNQLLGVAWVSGIMHVGADSTSFAGSWPRCASPRNALLFQILSHSKSQPSTQWCSVLILLLLPALHSWVSLWMESNSKNMLTTAHLALLLTSLLVPP